MNDWFEAEQRIERAQRCAEAHRWTDALREIEAALAINPHNATWHAQRGFILEELDQHVEAVDAYESSLALEADDRDVAQALGVALGRTGRLSQATDVFERLARMYPDFEPAYCHRIAIYTELGQHDLAEQMFYTAQELDDACPHCFFHIAESLAARGEFDRAIYCWRQVLDLEPEYVGVNRRIAQAFRARGDRKQAKEYLVRELREDAGNTDLLYDLAELAMESGDLAAAGAKFEQILELEDDHFEARFALGRIHLAAGRSKEALACFEAVETAVGPDGAAVDLDQRTGEALFNLSRHEEAANRFVRAAARQPNNTDLRMLEGTARLAGGQVDKAADCFRRVLALKGDHPFAHHSLAVCLFQTGKVEASLEHCLEAIRVKPDFGVAITHGAVASLRLARWSQARMLLGRAIALDADNKGLETLQRRIWRYRLRHILGRVFRPIKRVFRRRDA